MNPSMVLCYSDRCVKMGLVHDLAEAIVVLFFANATMLDDARETSRPTAV